MFGGGGIRFSSLADYESPEALRDFIIENNELIEELIEQHPLMAVMSPSSINTIRVFTLLGVPYFAVVRMGNGISRIDNACSGGLFSSIDLETGIINSDLYNFSGQVWAKHPKTNFVAKGYEIPYWDLCKKLVMETSSLIPGIPVVGWDLAITNDGPTLVEANSCPDIPLIQVSSGKGIKKQFIRDTEQIFKKN